MTTREPLRALDVCDHATEKAGAYLVCDERGRHVYHVAWCWDGAVRKSHRWTDAESACGAPRERQDLPDIQEGHPEAWGREPWRGGPL